MVNGIAAWIALALALALQPKPAGELRSDNGSIERSAPELDDLVPSKARIEVLATGFGWSEGPVWIGQGGGYLLFSDVPANRIHRWTATEGASLFLHPSGGTVRAGFREPGANGLKPGGSTSILVADQGNRAIARLDLRTKAKRFLARRFKGKKFNSPNDLAVGPDGSIWFTDPPYGLEGINASPLKEQPVNGVYRLAPDGQVALVESGLRFPNGIAFSRDGATLYVSNSDPARAVILSYQVAADGALSRRRVFSDMTALAWKGLPGLPDGMTVDERGNLWATGPGGVHVFRPDGRELGLISTGAAISNCAFGGSDGRTLFMTSGNKVAAVQTKVRGAPHRLPPVTPRAPSS
ncbi:MAG: Gluconolactonase [uncultured Sphingomonas sp.]|uniref:Gluconolactonase n=1 Tax=uncultured Sphingomonas sp. TaxID=158754 RepID=A0A6J4SGF2_9SPHN|nr:SMP-30/gluconolactonase/LRE family protein [uncultured Sphingomonas sp.]CAA9498745.1 MAG: Gluconolactonase [uncultured Sphingomonas sp.]